MVAKARAGSRNPEEAPTAGRLAVDRKEFGLGGRPGCDIILPTDLVIGRGWGDPLVGLLPGSARCSPLDHMFPLQTALDLVGDLACEPDLDRVLIGLGRIVACFGFDSFILSGIPDPGHRLDGHVLLSGWDPTWLEHYLAEDYFQVDPIARRLRTTETAFVWSETLAAEEIDPAGRRVLDEAAEIGMRDGFCIPLFDVGGRRAALSLAAERVELSPGERSLLQLVGLHAQTCVHRLLDSGRRRDGAQLSPRERECLQWTAVGKTSWETSSILGLSQSTTDGYIASAARKLGATNRIQAVAEAIRRGLID
jgi:LuxR family quorum sensing-dependent transcriptional regulator